MKPIQKLLITATLTLACVASVWANIDVRLLPGFVVLAEQRFDPAIQRFMAERSLAALPLRDGQLYYVYPLDAPRAQVEQMQIRYLEALLNQEAQKNRSDDEPVSR